jgi:hypothetical protein
MIEKTNSKKLSKEIFMIQNKLIGWLWWRNIILIGKKGVEEMTQNRIEETDLKEYNNYWHKANGH